MISDTMPASVALRFCCQAPGNVRHRRIRRVFGDAQQELGASAAAVALAFLIPAARATFGCVSAAIPFSPRSLSGDQITLTVAFTAAHSSEVIARYPPALVKLPNHR